MKLVTLKELLTVPQGTIFREFEPMAFSGEWMRFEEPCGDRDFFYSDIGPQPNSPPRGTFSVGFSDDIGRDGMFEDHRQYVVLDPADIELMIRQLRGELVGEQLPMPVQF